MKFGFNEYNDNVNININIIYIYIYMYTTVISPLEHGTLEGDSPVLCSVVIYIYMYVCFIQLKKNQIIKFIFD